MEERRKERKMWKERVREKLVNQHLFSTKSTSF